MAFFAYYAKIIKSSKILVEKLCIIAETNGISGIGLLTAYSARNYFGRSHLHDMGRVLLRQRVSDYPSIHKCHLHDMGRVLLRRLRFLLGDFLIVIYMTWDASYCDLSLIALVMKKIVIYMTWDASYCDSGCVLSRNFGKVIYMTWDASYCDTAWSK